MDSQKNIETALPLLVPFVPGLTNPVALYALAGGLREFCRRAEAWRETIDVTTVTDQETYSLATEMDERNALLLRVRQIRFDDSDSAIAEEYYAVTEAGALVFDDPYPDDWGTTMNVDAVMLPKVNSRQAPAWLIDRWQEVIAEWALAEIFAQAGKPWRDIKAAMQHMDKFHRGVGEAIRESITGRKSGAVKMFPDSFV